MDVKKSEVSFGKMPKICCLGKKDKLQNSLYPSHLILKKNRGLPADTQHMCRKNIQRILSTEVISEG